MRPKHRFLHDIRHSFFIAGLLGIVWLIFRTGPKPSRFVYPCQQAAAAAGYLWILTYLALPIAAFVSIRRWATPGRVAFMIGGILLVSSVLTIFYVANGTAGASSIGYPGTGSFTEEASVSSDIFIVQGKTGHDGGFNNLLALMRTNGLEFYQLSDPNAGNPGIIGRNDVVLIKVNCQWPERGGTNTDLVKAVIEAILSHPEGFAGEIVVVDNGQGRGSFTWENANAENTGQSIQDVVDAYSGSHRVSTYLWDTLTTKQVGEYSTGNMEDGYILNTTPNPRTGLKVSYPKFRTIYGTRISFRRGVWENGAYNNSRLKLINMPVLKTHDSYEVTANLKHYVGVVSVPLGDPHGTIDRGGMGTAMVETRYPDLNILDATWINAIPQGYSGVGPSTPYGRATRTDTIAASRDPIALDYYAAKYILMPRTATAGYSTNSIDPDNLSPGSFGSWLQAAMQEIRGGGYQVTADESQMNILKLSVGPWTSPGGYTLNSVAMDAKSSAGEWFAVIRGTDNHVYFNRYTQLTNAWTGWTPIGGTTYDEPAVAYTGNDCVHVVVRGSDNSLYYKKLNLGTDTWDPTWTSIGGHTSSAPTLLSWSSSQISGDPSVLPDLWLSVRGTDNHLYLKRWTPASGWESAWQSWGGTTLDRPSLAFLYDTGSGNGILTLGVRGTDTRVYTRDYAFGSGGSGTIGTWTSPGGSTLSPPVIYYKEGVLHVVVRGTDSHMYHKEGSNPYIALGGTTSDIPAVYCWQDQPILEVSVRGTDSTIYNNILNLYTHQQTGWINMEHTAAGNPTFSRGTGSGGVLAIRGADNGVYMLAI